MNNDERKAIIEKAARALNRHILRGEEAKAEANKYFDAYDESTRKMYSDDAEAVLESIGYFGIVTAARDVVADATVCLDCEEDSQVRTHYIKELRDALQRGVTHA